MADRHLTPQELARRERVPLKSVYVWNSTGTGPRYLRVGRHVRYRLSDVIAWEAARLVDRGRDLGGDAA
jgi:predicted DNA-binding transcriptional regulator AlpA